MKIAIIGTRGIPNHYGGFEQFAEYLAVGLVDRGHAITVYNSHSHPYKENSWQGINLIHKYDPEDIIGTFGQFVYDFNCIRDLEQHSFDIILQLGYTSNSIWYKLLPKNPIIITNMDGLEWKRSKYNKLTQHFLKYAEKLAAFNSDELISDSIGIKNHLLSKYDLQSTFIPYGADLFKNPNRDVLRKYSLAEYSYNLLIARMEPENNIEKIIEGHIASQTTDKLVLIGSTNNKFGTYLKTNYDSDKLIFLGGIYDQSKLNNLRYFSNLYFHGHSVGGTNPSLLEAMASNSLICAHNNIFNKSILENNAFYFDNSTNIKKLLDLNIKKSDNQIMINNNTSKIKEEYSWSSIISQYEHLFTEAISKTQ